MLNDSSDIKIESGKLYLRGESVETEYPVINAFSESGRTIVLFDPDSYTEKFGQFPNLIALDNEGQKIWTAQLPTTQSGDRYFQVRSTAPLIANSIYSYRCEIDSDTGRIRQKDFYK